MSKPCQRDHEAMKADDEVWSLLPLASHRLQPAYTGDPADDLELRNCPCGSTLARRVGAARP